MYEITKYSTNQEVPTHSVQYILIPNILGKNALYYLFY